MNQSIATLKELIKKNKVVIFIGAGVSRNSKVPTWGQLVRYFAKELPYLCCQTKSCKHAHCHEDGSCPYRFCTDEYIKIPQYYYDSYGKKAYQKIISNVFNQAYQPNILDDLIVSLKPCHLITTNYDHLLDGYDYQVIKNDSDLLTATHSEHYLIKMHGDLSDLDSLILKEDDYLQYSQTHPLTELYIKSLLIDHSFLFVGYSLNDYNLKTFLSWIDYMGSSQNVREKMPKHYLVTMDILPQEDYLFSYYERKNITVIDLNSLPQTLYEASKKVPLEEEVGRLVYTLLAQLK